MVGADAVRTLRPLGVLAAVFEERPQGLDLSPSHLARGPHGSRIRPGDLPDEARDVRDLAKFRFSHGPGLKLNHYPFLPNVPDPGV